MTHAHAFRFSVNPLPGLSSLARLRSLAHPAGQGLLLAALLLFLAGTAQAAGSSMPWEGPLQSILDSIQGPVARIVAVIIIIATGLALASATPAAASASSSKSCSVCPSPSPRPRSSCRSSASPAGPSYEHGQRSSGL